MQHKTAVRIKKNLNFFNRIGFAPAPDGSTSCMTVVSGWNLALRHPCIRLLGLAAVLRARAGFGEVRIRVLYDRVRIPMAQLALQGGIARLFAVVVLGGSFGLVLVMGILRHSYS